MGSFHRGGTFEPTRHSMPVVGCIANACTTVKFTMNRVIREARSGSSVGMSR